MTHSPDRKGAFLTRLGLALVLLPLGLLGVQILLTTDVGCACGGPQDRGRYGISLIRSMQIDYHDRHGTFAPTLPLLQQTTSLEIPPSYTQSFQFSIQATPDRAIIYATPLDSSMPVDRFHLGLRTLEFRSIMSATAFYNGEYISIVCESNSPTTAKPPEPILTQGRFACPAYFNQR